MRRWPRAQEASPPRKVKKRKEEHDHEQVTNESKGRGLGDQKAWAFRLCKQILWDQKSSEIKKSVRLKILWDQQATKARLHSHFPLNKNCQQHMVTNFVASWPKQNIQKWKHGSTEISGKTFKTSDSHSLYGFVIIWVPNLTGLRCAGP